MVGSSLEVWQEMQPEDLRLASSWDWPLGELFCTPSCCAADAARGCSAKISKARQHRTHKKRRNDPNRPRNPLTLAPLVEGASLGGLSVVVGGQQCCAPPTEDSNATCPGSLCFLLMIGASQNVNFTEPKSENCVR